MTQKSILFRLGTKVILSSLIILIALYFAVVLGLNFLHLLLVHNTNLLAKKIAFSLYALKIDVYYIYVTVEMLWPNQVDQ